MSGIKNILSSSFPLGLGAEYYNQDEIMLARSGGVKKASYSFVLTIMMTFIFGCRLPQLSIDKRSIEPGILKTHGFYYNKPDYWSFMLYNNGVFKGDFGVDEKNIQEVINSFTDSNYLKNDYKIPYDWGLYRVKGDSIYIEHWQSREWAVFGVTKYSGIILNDSTLLLDHPVVGKDTFYFHYLPVIPDSTNKFIK